MRLTSSVLLLLAGVIPACGPASESSGSSRPVDLVVYGHIWTGDSLARGLDNDKGTEAIQNVRVPTTVVGRRVVFSGP